MTEQVAAPAAPAAPKAGAPAAPGSDTSLVIGEAAPSPDPLKAEPAGPVVIEFNSTGDSGLDMALGFFGKLGLGPGDAAFDAATAGDFSMLKAKLGQLGAKAQGYEGFVALAEQSYAKNAETHKAKVAKDTAAVIAEAGGEAQWKAIQTWASANAEPEEKAAVNAALKQGGVAAKAMAAWLAGKYAKAQGTTVEPTAEVTAEGAASRAGASSGALSAKQYAAECAAARAKLGYAFDGSREYQSLQARRVAGQRAGI